MGLHFKKDRERLDRDIQKANQTARVRSTRQERLGLFSQAKRKLMDGLITAYSYLKHSYRDDGAKLCSGTWYKTGNSHKLQLRRVRLEDEFN